MALKKKKLYESQLEQVENNILRVNEQQMGLENLRTTVETVDALRTGAHASKQTMQARARAAAAAPVGAGVLCAGRHGCGNGGAAAAAVRGWPCPTLYALLYPRCRRCG